MATIVLSAVGAAAGASVGGGVLGLSSVVIGRAIGAGLGRAVDARLMGAGSEPVETGRVDRFRLTGAGEGAAIAQVYGRMRVPGQVIWASRFVEIVQGGGSGKGGGGRRGSVSYSYSVSLAIALCEGVITRVGRVWADGRELVRDDLNMRVYRGTEDQLPDPKIEAVEGAGTTPAYRGVAYVVLEDLDLGQFGNRVPQFSFEVFRPAQEEGRAPTDPAMGIRGVALIPGSGEYALATTPVYLDRGNGKVTAANVNTPSGKSDFATSVEALDEELPNCGSVSLVVSWFGDDLRCDRASLRPKVEQAEVDGRDMAWRVSGVGRAGAALVPKLDGAPVYGGTPADASVIEAIRELRRRSKQVVFYPFILMDQLPGNGLTDPWTGAPGQPALPWRGRITLSLAPGQAGSPDGTAAAQAEVAAFFGAAQPGDFTPAGDTVDYAGPEEWSYRRFILHYAHLCAAAGGVEAFCIGSEMRALTSIRGEGNSFPAVAELRRLAADVRAILGPDCKIGYAADWSEYFGYHPQDGSGDVFFHLDPLWADPEIDFIGIDNYMPLADWRDGDEHLDAHWGAIHNTGYLKANIAGGEGYDWYYPGPEARDAQLRVPIEDGAHGEPWVFRYKDIRAWWSNPHHERIGGVRQATPTPWVPQSKPIWFTEYGCAAVDKGANQPNRFLDAKSSESGLPHYSDGRRDELMQAQYIRAMLEYWNDEANNPVSPLYGGPMVDMSRAHVWAWDARPYPFFPANRELWSDAENYYRGHWINGRVSARGLADVVAEICARAGLREVDVSALWGLVRGYAVNDADSARAALQPLMLAFGFEAMERGGQLVFRNRDGRARAALDAQAVAWLTGQDSPVEKLRAGRAEQAGRLRLSYVDADGDYEVRAEEAVFADEPGGPVAATEMALLLTGAEARAVTERWLAEARVARDGLRLALPPSGLALGAGDVIEWRDDEERGRYRIDRVTLGEGQLIEAVRVEEDLYRASDAADSPGVLRPFVAPVPVWPVFLDLPLLRGSEVPHAPHVAATAQPWPGSVAIHSATTDNGYVLNHLLNRAAVMGTTASALAAARPGMIDRGAPLRVVLGGGALASASLEEVLAGANLAAIGDGSSANWELFQFTDAVLVGPDTWEISGRLRGQAGSDALPSTDWPAGSIFVLLDGAVEQVALDEAARGLARHWRIGPAGRPPDDPSYLHLVAAFDGIGLRPLAPVHLRARREGTGDLAVSWIRRTRIDGDSWQSVEVPLGEESESYLVRVMQAGAVVREETASTPAWRYAAADQAADGVVAPYRIEVAQISARFGPGLFRKVEING